MSWFTPAVNLYDVTAPLSPIAVGDYTIDRVSIQYGRQSVNDTISPSSCNVTLLYDSSLGTFDPSSIELGYALEVIVAISGGYGNWRRFYGNVTDIAIGKDTVSLVAVSSLISRWGKYLLPSAVTMTNTSGPIIQQLVTTASGAQPGTVFPAVNFYWPGLYTQSVSFAAGTNALEAMYGTIAGEPFAFFWEDFSVQAFYASDQTTRDIAVPDVTLAGTEILDDWEVSTRVDSQITQAVVNYIGGTETYTAPSSSIGNLQVSVDTYLDSATNAQQLAQFLVGRGTKLRYDVDSITVPISAIPFPRAANLVTTGFAINKLVRIPQLRSYINTDYFVEGWSEEIGQSYWSMELYMSDVARTRYYQKWQTVPSGTRWQDVDATLTWSQLTYEWIP